jgi:deoxyribodipyrimidine photo-lyase
MDKPEDIIPKLATTGGPCEVVVQGEVTWEEMQIEHKVEKALKNPSKPAASGRLHRVMGGCSLYHPDDIPFRSDLQDIPNTFTVFKDKVEKRCSVRSLLPTVSLGRWPVPTLTDTLKDTSNFNFLPTLQQLGFTYTEIERATDKLDSRGVMRFIGGEDAVKRRVEEWMFRDDRLKDYFEIRNGMLGEAYSSKLSPWLAAGCVSPRYR